MKEWDTSIIVRRSSTIDQFTLSDAKNLRTTLDKVKRAHHQQPPQWSVVIRNGYSIPNTTVHFLTNLSLSSSPFLPFLCPSRSLSRSIHPHLSLIFNFVSFCLVDTSIRCPVQLIFAGWRLRVSSAASIMAVSCFSRSFKIGYLGNFFC